MKRGCCPTRSRSACRQSAPRALYTVPTLHNPTTAVMSLERRQRIIEIARQYDVTIIEDDVFGFLMPRHLRRSNSGAGYHAAHQQPVQKHPRRV